MPANKKTKPKSRQIKFSPSRLIKTNGRFSKGKLLVVIVSVVAIGTIIVSLANAWSYQNVVNWQDVAGHGWVDTNHVNCQAQFGGCDLFTIGNPPIGDIFWFGPYTTLGIPNPSGSDGQMCANMRVLPGTAESVYVSYEITANYGNTILWRSANSYIVNPSTSYHLICVPFHIPQPRSVWPGFSNVEYRLRYQGASHIYNVEPPVLSVAQVGIFIK